MKDSNFFYLSSIVYQFKKIRKNIKIYLSEFYQKQTLRKRSPNYDIIAHRNSRLEESLRNNSELSRVIQSVA